MIKKFYFLVGLGLGFVLGSRAGRQAYEQLEGRAKEVLAKPEVKAKVEKAQHVAGDRVGTVIDLVSAKRNGKNAGRKIPPRNEAELDAEVEGTFPSSDPPSTWAGGTP